MFTQSISYLHKQFSFSRFPFLDSFSFRAMFSNGTVLISEYVLNLQQQNHRTNKCCTFRTKTDISAGATISSENWPSWSTAMSRNHRPFCNCWQRWWNDVECSTGILTCIFMRGSNARAHTLSLKCRVAYYYNYYYYILYYPVLLKYVILRSV